MKLFSYSLINHLDSIISWYKHSNKYPHRALFVILYQFNTDLDLTIGEKPKKDKPRTLKSKLSFLPNKETKYVAYLEQMNISGSGRVASISMQINDKTLFLEPGLIHIYDSEPPNEEQQKMKEEWLNILATYDLNLKSYGYRFSFSNLNQ